MKINDIADIINVTEKDPATSGIDIFVGLEHYDIAEPVIKRFGSTKMLSTAAKKFETGDVLIARRNVYLQRASIARFAGLTSGDSIVLRVKKDLDVKGTDYDNMCALIPFILNSINFWDYANTNADGTMSKRLSPAMLLDYEFTLPSLAEQKVLAEKLWAAYEVKQSYLKMIAATEEMVKAQFVEMFASTECIPLNSLVTLSKSSIMPKTGTTYTLYSFPAYDNNQTPEVIEGSEIKSSKISLEENVVLYNKLNVRLSRVWNIQTLNSLNNICSSEFLPLKVKDSSVISQPFLYRILNSDYVTKK